MDRKIAVGLFLLVDTLIVAVVVGVIAMQPDHIHLERTTTIAGTAADLAPFAEDLKLVNEWSPWVGRDPAMVQTYSEDTVGVGAWYTWSGNDDVGEGKQTIVSVEPGKVVQQVDFIRPFEGTINATLSYTEADGDLAVVWGFDQDAGFVLKAMTLVMSMEDTLGSDYEQGLASLKPLVEAAAVERQTQEALAAEEAQAKEAAAAAAAAPQADDKAASKKRKKK